MSWSIWRTSAVLSVLATASLVPPAGPSRNASCVADALRSPASARASRASETLPLYFEVNRGQAAPEVKFVSRGPRHALALTPAEAIFVLAGPERDVRRPSVLRMRLAGANPLPLVSGREELRGKVNYFVGNDPATWRTNVPTYGRVEYSSVYPGIDLVYYGHQGQLEYDFIVHPGGDPSRIALRFAGATGLDLDGGGDLVLRTRGGAVRQRKPFVYQNAGGARQPIAASYVLDDEVVSFALGDYDATKPLVIDPVLDYSSFLGGSAHDFAYGVGVDANGNTYLAGQTFSVDFPTANPLDSTLDNLADAFVTKIDATGRFLMYSTYLGGSGKSNRDLIQNIAVDQAGNAYVTGYTDSIDFPTTPGAFDTTCGSDGTCDGADVGFGLPDAFVTKLAPGGGVLLYSTFLGGSSTDRGRDIAVDGLGNAYIVGFTLSSDLPVTPGAPDPVCDNCPNQSEVFIVRLGAGGSALGYCTYLGGSLEEDGWGIAVDGVGNAYVTGDTWSFDFPVVNPLQPVLNPVSDVFVSKVNAAGTALLYSTYLGGSDGEEAFDIAVSALGHAYVTGDTYSTDFPTTPDAFQRTHISWSDVFVAKLEPGGRALVYSTYLGDGAADVAYGLAVDDEGNAYVTGVTQSQGFPVANPFQPSHGGGTWDGFVAKLNARGSALMYSSFLGGADDDEGGDLALTGAGSVVIAGRTWSPDFPVTPDALDDTCGTDGICNAPYTNDAFVSRVRPAPCVGSCLRSSDIQFVVRRWPGITVFGAVRVVDRSGLAVPGATVSVTWRRPNGTEVPKSATTNEAGIAWFGVFGGSGTYTLTVTDLAAAGFGFDADNSSLSKRITG